MITEFYLPLIQKPSISGKQLNGCCPFHDDKEPSFSINLETGQYKCQAESCGEKGNVFTFAKKMSVDIPNELKEFLTKDYTMPKRKVITEYDYTDEEGNVLYTAVRLKPKRFAFKRTDENGDVIWDIKGVRRVPYNLPGVLKSKLVIISEGEKDAKALIDSGLCATTNPFGAGKWESEFNQYFQDKEVAIIPDNDDPGKKHARDVANNLLWIANSVRIVHLPPEIGDSRDVSDYLGDHKMEDLMDLIDKATEYQHSDDFKISDKEKGIFVRLRDYMERGPKEAEWIVEGLIPKTAITILSGYPKTGKTLLTFNLAIAISRGEPILDRETKQGKVIMFQMEDPGYTIRERFIKMGFGKDEHIYINDSTPPIRGRIETIKTEIERIQPDLLVLDPMIYALGFNDENDSAQVARAIEPLKRIAETNELGILLVHHNRKGSTSGPESIRGSSAIFGAVDMAITLGDKKKIENALKLDMNIFGRLCGESSHIIELDPATLTWKCSSDRKGEFENVIRDQLAKNSGMTIDEIEEITAIPEKTCENYLKGMADIKIGKRKTEGRGRPKNIYMLNNLDN